ncbi:hypothetical protein [Leifsonia sp. AG29]|uniref:hypothetical protein n=1 Tax=Leifsonia sp. AG29 TaxID=2598860 RepID=UPI001E3BEB9C|nr:hypothetical protein [Leifsonia sp. AG29]
MRPREVADPRPSDTSIISDRPADRPPAPAVAGRFPSGLRSADAEEDDGLAPTEAIVLPIESAPRATAPRPFTLSFSTGEVVEVTGSGLLGRRPITQPGETVDQLVVVSDPARSVSKTHLEFGLEGGELWICDRYSGNGTVAHPLGGVARHCEAGRRYRVTRGTRVEIGDQWFDVS